MVQDQDIRPRYLHIVGMGFVAALLVSNIAAQKLFSLGPFVFTAGILIFPISYILGDVMSEVYGFRRTSSIIIVGMLANTFMALVLALAIALPPAPGWTSQEAFALVHSTTPRIVLASILGYLGGEFVNAAIMVGLKRYHQGRHLWVRTISSTFFGQFVDTALFIGIGFVGTIPSSLLLVAIVSGWLFKTGYEVLATPVTYFIVGYLKRKERALTSEDTNMGDVS